MLKIFPGKGTQQGSVGAGGGGFQREFVAPTPTTRASDFPTLAHPRQGFAVRGFHSRDRGHLLEIPFPCRRGT